MRLILIATSCEISNQKIVIQARDKITILIDKSEAQRTWNKTVIREIEGTYWSVFTTPNNRELLQMVRLPVRSEVMKTSDECGIFYINIAFYLQMFGRIVITKRLVESA